MTMPVTGQTTFSQIEQRFGMDQGGKDKHLRFDNAKGLYTSDKASLAKLKDKLGFPEQLQARYAKRDQGAATIRQAIEQEYGQGMGQRVLANLAQKGIDLSAGVVRSVMRSDLGVIRQAIDEELSGQASNALQDPGLQATHGTGSKGNAMRDFLRQNFEVCSSPEVWAHQGVRANAEAYGCGLALAVLDRIHQNGRATDQDVQDLQRVFDLAQFTAGAGELAGVKFEFGAAADQPPPDVANEVARCRNDTEKLAVMEKLVYQRFVAAEGPVALNLTEEGLGQQDSEGKTAKAALRKLHNDFTAASNPTDGLSALHRAFDAAMDHNAIVKTPMATALENISRGDTG